MSCVSSVTWSTFDLPRQKPACSRGSFGSTTGTMRLCINLSRIVNGTHSSEMGLYDLGSCAGLFGCNACMVHGFLPSTMTDTILVPIIKDKTGNASSKANYRPIALTSVLSKVFETALLSKLESVFETSDYQFGFKSHHSTDLCIYTLKEIVEYYKSHSTSVYVCFMDASKAFDRVNHWTLFKKNDRQRNASYIRSINSNMVL